MDEPALMLRSDAVLRTFVRGRFGSESAQNLRRHTTLSGPTNTYVGRLQSKASISPAMWSETVESTQRNKVAKVSMLHIGVMRERAGAPL